MKKKYLPWLLIGSLVVGAVSIRATSPGAAVADSVAIYCVTDTIPRDTSRKYQRGDSARGKMPVQRQRKDSSTRKRDTTINKGL